MREFERVMRDIKQSIDHGRLLNGQALPSERQSALHYRVSRSTIRRAWQELEAIGYITWTSQSTPTVIGPPQWPTRVERSPVGRMAPELQPGFLGDLMQAAVSPARYNFEIGMPDPELFPVTDFHRILRELFGNPSREVFGYSPTAGLERVRQAIREEYLFRRGLKPQMEEILVTAGSLQGLDLLTRLWVQPGDVVVVESPTFAGALHVFRSHGARIVGIPVDQEGLRTDLLPTLLRGLPTPRFLYVQPVAQNPTGVTLSANRREALMAWARSVHVPIVEDDAYGFLADTPPLAALDFFPVVYLNTFSKILAPGIRVGFLVAPADLVRQLASLKQLSDLHTGTLSQLVAEGWLRMADIDAHIQRARTIYGSRIKTAVKVLSGIPELEPFAEPSQGFYLFARVPSGTAVPHLHQEAVKQEILFAPGEPFGVERHEFPEWIRLAVSAQPTAQIETGLRRLAHLIRREAGGGLGGLS